MKLKRLVSAVLAVGMALTMLPTAAFAADTTPAADPNHITGIVLNADGSLDPKNTEGATQDKNNDKKWSGNGWTYDGTNFTILKNYVFNQSSISEGGPVFQEKINNYGTIASGSYDKTVFNYGTISGGEFTGRVYNVVCITGGTFTYVSNRAFESYTNAGQVKGGVIENYVVETKDGGTLENTIVWGSLTERTKGIVISGILPKMSNQIADTSKYYMVEAPGCTIASSYNGQEFSIKDQMLVVDKDETPEMTVTVTPSSQERKIDHWEVTGISDYTSNSAGGITFTVPAGNTEEITVTAVREEISLTASNDLPVEGKNDDGTYGSAYDGWYYNETENNGETQKNLTIYSSSHSSEDYVVNLGNEQVDWKVQNNGTIAGGKYTDTVKNYGKITGGTFAGKFSNCDAVEDKNANATGEGTVESGVFSRSADFGTQTPDITWLNVNNGTINNVDGFSMAGIVGKQTVTIKTTDANFTGWVVSGDSDLTLTEEQRTSKELTLTLDGSKKNTIVLTAMTPEGYQHFSVIDGKAYNENGDEITSAKAGDTVKLTAADAPDGMVFDRWEITPSDIALTLEEAGFDSHAATASFKMPAQTLNIRAMYRMADQPEEPNVLGTVAMVATAGVGAAVVGYTGYMIGTELYLNTVLPEGTAIPNNTTELAKLVWNDAGRPEPIALLAADATDEQKALTWAVENQLISADKAADASVTRWEVIQTWNKAQELKK